MWWMPWVFVPIKEVQDCFKPRGAVKKRYHSGISEWGNPTTFKRRSLITQSLVYKVIGGAEGTRRTETT